MSVIENEFAAVEETGTLGVLGLKRAWSQFTAARKGVNLRRDKEEWQINRTIIYTLGLGLEQTIQYVYKNAPTFEEFEAWINTTVGGVDPVQVARINAMINGTEYPQEIKDLIKSIEEHEPVLTDEDLRAWDENGYVVLHNAVTPEECKNSENAIWTHLGASADDPESWYRQKNNGIMVQFFQHPAFTAVRSSKRIHKAFAQLWGTADLWRTTDRCGFNVPERPGWTFQGPDMHWDVSIKLPVPFGTQGILYLTDTLPEQGAFTLVPGFHKKIDKWIASLPEGTNPREENLHALGSKPLGGKAGDLIIWHHALPHGSRPNRAEKPRIVQYIDMYPTKVEVQDEWI